MNTFEVAGKLPLAETAKSEARRESVEATDLIVWFAEWLIHHPYSYHYRGFNITLGETLHDSDVTFLTDAKVMASTPIPRMNELLKRYEGAFFEGKGWHELCKLAKAKAGILMAKPINNPRTVSAEEAPERVMNILAQSIRHVGCTTSDTTLGAAL